MYIDIVLIFLYLCHLGLLDSYEKQITVYPLPLVLTALCTLPDKRCLSQDMCLYQVVVVLTSLMTLNQYNN